jgi:hypothetical protein
MDLAVGASHLAVGEHGERVVGGGRGRGDQVVGALRGSVRLDHAHQGDDALDSTGELPQGLAHRRQELAPKQQVLGRISGQGELGEEDQLGARVARLLHPPAGQLEVAFDVPHGGVDLGKRQSQVRRFGHEPSMAVQRRR